jgi:hypothetical protein
VNHPRALIAVLLLASTPTRAQVASRPAEFNFAKAKIGRFETTATTTLNWRDNTPRIQSISCVGDNGEIRFVVDRTGRLQQLQIGFVGPSVNGNPEHLTLLGDALWLFVDGKRYEYRNIPIEDRFANYSYPPAPAGTIILPDFRGYEGVRVLASEPFMNLARIYADIVKAKSLRWAFKSRNWKQVNRSVPENALPPGWQHQRYRIDNEKLNAAVDWCTKAVASERARDLPPQFSASGK